ncbi:hypothetical protein TRFO_09727 [Tritrichomonas foetus]|uniref:Uncharacterized protein n=1 Tax=Tritrichomonas foetus TaxID=1144522 RepID=A0A1J4JH74_9EUKA|nr:hypothetical protein TRFO_09727 [Tritrichomonas foetus]|eukprot:OHS96837.1 hypothetical protein TRFO_09727 [Tritrichomonas foetus]
MSSIGRNRRPSQISQLLKDITLPDEYRNFTKVLKARKIKEFLCFLLGPVCPYPPQIRDSLTPSQMRTEEFSKVLDNLINLFKTQPNIFIPVPLYTISYLSALFSLLSDKTHPQIILDFIMKYIGLKENEIPEEAFGVILPVILYNTTSDEQQIRTNFILFLVDNFNVNIILKHLLNVYESAVASGSMITRFNINVLTKIAELFSFDQTNYARARNLAESLTDSPSRDHVRTFLRTLEMDEEENQQSQPSDLTTPKNLRQGQIGRKSVPNLSINRSSLIGGNSYSPSNLAPSLKSISPEILEEYLDMIDRRDYKVAINILNDVRQQLERLHHFPQYKPFEPLFKLALETYANDKTSPEEKKSIYLLISNVNNTCDPSGLLKLYLSFKDESKYPHEFLEQCYQHFLKTSHLKDKLPANTYIPVSLVAASEKNHRKDVEFAFTCLNKWDSSYDGVRRIWELLKSEPDTDISEYFDQLIFTQKTFLVEGLRNCLEDEGGNNKIMETVINKLDDRMMSETRTDRVTREASMVAEKMDQIISSEKKNESLMEKTKINISSIPKVNFANAASSGESQARENKEKFGKERGKELRKEIPASRSPRTIPRSPALKTSVQRKTLIKR